MEKWKDGRMHYSPRPRFDAKNDVVDDNEEYDEYEGNF